MPIHFICIGSGNVDPVLRRHMASLGHNELSHFSPILTKYTDHSITRVKYIFLYEI